MDEALLTKFFYGDYALAVASLAMRKDDTSPIVVEHDITQTRADYLIEIARGSRANPMVRLVSES